MFRCAHASTMIYSRVMYLLRSLRPDRFARRPRRKYNIVGGRRISRRLSPSSPTSPRPPGSLYRGIARRAFYRDRCPSRRALNRGPAVCLRPRSSPPPHRTASQLGRVRQYGNVPQCAFLLHDSPERRSGRLPGSLPRRPLPTRRSSPARPTRLRHTARYRTTTLGASKNGLGVGL